MIFTLFYTLFIEGPDLRKTTYDQLKICLAHYSPLAEAEVQGLVLISPPLDDEVVLVDNIFLGLRRASQRRCRQKRHVLCNTTRANSKTMVHMYLSVYVDVVVQ